MKQWLKIQENRKSTRDSLFKMLFRYFISFISADGLYYLSLCGSYLPTAALYIFPTTYVYVCVVSRSPSSGGRVSRAGSAAAAGGGDEFTVHRGKAITTLSAMLRRELHNDEMGMLYLRIIKNVFLFTLAIALTPLIKPWSCEDILKYLVILVKLLYSHTIPNFSHLNL